MSKNQTINKAYWEKNIEGFSKFYDSKSEERIFANPVFSWIYRNTAFPIEKKYMMERFNVVNDYIERTVQPGMVVADIGCGSGIFLRKFLERGARVHALDYVASALALARREVDKGHEAEVEFREFDVLRDMTPKVDVAISIGVLTYIPEIDIYFDHILPSTQKFFFNYLDSTNVLNRLRKATPFLDVRRLTYHDPSAVRQKLEERGFGITRTTRLATGYMVEAEANKKTGAGTGG